MALMACAAGCGSARSLELTGEEAKRRLPAEFAELLPSGAILCLDEEGQDGAYHLCILRHPGGSYIDRLASKKFEQHAMPASALEAILAAKLSGLDRGRLTERRGRHTHWRASDGAEIQVREIVTDRGWFASVERVRF